MYISSVSKHRIYVSSDNTHFRRNSAENTPQLASQGQNVNANEETELVASIRSGSDDKDYEWTQVNVVAAENGEMVCGKSNLPLQSRHIFIMLTTSLYVHCNVYIHKYRKRSHCSDRVSRLCSEGVPRR